MKTDKYGQQIYTEQDICELYMENPNIELKELLVNADINITNIIDTSALPKLIRYQHNDIDVPEFDALLQSQWFLPESYKTFDIAEYVINLCKTDEELSRVEKELLMFHERGMFPLLVYLKYLVDTMREHNIVWGVGRGSSVASYVLFLLGVHKIDSLSYQLNIDEFLK